MFAFGECDACGYRFRAAVPFGGGNGQLTMSGSVTLCPRCGAAAKLVDGTYSFVGGVLEAFSRANVAELEKLNSIVKAASEGEISDDEAVKQVGQISGEFVRILELFLRFGIPGLLVSLVALYIQCSALKSSDDSANALLHELQSMRATIEQRVTGTATASDWHLHSRQAYSSQRLHAKQQVPKSETPQNRHQRRKSQKLSRNLSRDY